MAPCRSNQAAKMGHYANGKPLRITATDRDAVRALPRLLGLVGRKVCRSAVRAGKE